MGNSKIDLKDGIRLEISETLVPWKTRFDALKEIGRPEYRKQTDRQIVVWKNERILNGLRVDLSVVYEQGIYSENRKLSSVSAYLCESTFQEAKQQLEEILRTKGKFRKLNELEYTYSWSVDHCDIRLSHLDRFGSFWKLDITRRPGLAGALNIRRIISRLPGIRKEEKGPYFMVGTPVLALN
jgi:hypothetical protein